LIISNNHVTQRLQATRYNDHAHFMGITELFIAS